MAKIRAAVCHEFGAPLVVEEVMLAAPRPHEVEVTLAACAVCHSDISAADGGWGGTLPAVYGHEAVGRISAAGAAVTGVAPGDTVLVTLFRSCGHCLPCLTMHPGACQNSADTDLHPLTRSDGTRISQGIRTGGFAERVVVEQTQVVRIPADLPPAPAALLSCGVITGIGAVVNTAGLRAGQRAVVIGAGGVGLNAIQGARIAGAAHIVAVDMVPAKLEIAREFGATAGILATDPEPWNAAREVMGAGADHVFVCTGAIRVFDTASRYLGHMGKTVLVGMPHSGQTTAYEPVDLGATGQQIVGSKMGDGVPQRDIPWMVELYRQGRLKLDELVSRRWPLERINDALADTRSGAARRNVIVFDQDNSV